MNANRCLCIDIETTGLERPEAWPIEFGFAVVAAGDSGMTEWQLAEIGSELLNVQPGKPIPAESKAVHHITEDMLAQLGINRDAAVELITGRLASAPYIAAHVAKFEHKFLSYFAPDSARWICTWKVACQHYPDLKQHDLQFLRYALDLDCDPVLAMPPHRAAPDAYVCAALLMHFLQSGLTLDQMADISAKPCRLPWVTFGKHAGQRWAEVPTGYLEWCDKHITDDEDVAYTVREEIWARRKAGKSGKQHGEAK